MNNMKRNDKQNWMISAGALAVLTMVVAVRAGAAGSEGVTVQGPVLHAEAVARAPLSATGVSGAVLATMLDQVVAWSTALAPLRAPAEEAG